VIVNKSHGAELYLKICGMSYPNVLFVAELESLDPFLRTFANQPHVVTISFHFREIPL